MGGVPLLIAGGSMRAVAEVEQGLESRVEELGFELVDIQWVAVADGRSCACASTAPRRCRMVRSRSATVQS